MRTISHECGHNATRPSPQPSPGVLGEGEQSITRRSFLASAAILAGCQSARRNPTTRPIAKAGIIDLHQHTNYTGRPDNVLIAHQNTMGIAITILLPAGSIQRRASTHFGRSNGLAAATGGNESCLALVKQSPDRFRFFANEVPDLDDSTRIIEKYLNLGAIGIGEQKFNVDCDSAVMERIYAVARDYGVPVLMHFQHAMYNKGYERFGKVLAKWPRVNFIGHAQTFWANVDANHTDQTILYPKTKVIPGGLTDRYLSDHPNLYADLSAGSGLNALLRDEDHAVPFIQRHHKKLIYGSDCNDHVGSGPKCSGSQQLATLRRLAPSPEILQMILHDNATRIMRI